MLGFQSNIISLLQKTIYSHLKLNDSLVKPILLYACEAWVPFPVESLLLWYHLFVLMMSSDIHKNPGPMVDPNKKI